MATYTKTVWNTGDLITADKMNKVETQLETVTPGATGAVRSDTSQSLNDTEKATARTNIAAASTADITTLTNNLNSAETSIAPAFSTSTNYTVGDLVIYNDKLYRFITAHAAGGWDINQVEEVNIADQLEKKANIDGYYESLNVGTADQLNSTIYVEDNQPYTFRTSGGNADIGDKVEDMLVGGTIAWNQFSYENNIVTLSTGGSRTIALSTGSQSAKANHVYLYSVNIISTSIAGKLAFQYGGSSPFNTIAGYNAVIVNSGTSNLLGYVYLYIGTSEDTSKSVQFNNFQVFDLTQMFGSTIADYIYSLEQANAGAGVTWFKKLFPKPYYEYNAGELISVAAAKKIATGFNQFDSSTAVAGQFNSSGEVVIATDRKVSDYIPVIPNTTYYVKNVIKATEGRGVVCYSNDKGFIVVMIPDNLTAATDGTITIPNNVAYIRIGVMNENVDTACVNLSWSGYRDGEYESYHKSITEFDPNLELRGIAKLDANNNLYYDGDTYESDGTVTRKYGIVDLGSLTWYYNETSGIFYTATLDGAATVSLASANKANVICGKYITVAGTGYNGGTDKSISIGALYVSGAVNVKDSSYSDVAIFKSAMSGVYLVYELATPTTEESIPFTKFAYVNDFGTEEFVDSLVEKDTRDVSMPVGHESKYLANLRDKLQHLPDSTSEDGIFVIKQENKQMEIQPFKGYYPDVTVDTANQLAATQYESDKVPYKFRTTGGSADVGNRAYVDKIIGGTVAWNQLVNPSNLTPTNTYKGVTSTVVSGFNISVSGTATGAETWPLLNRNNPLTVGHKYLLIGTSVNGSARLRVGGSVTRWDAAGLGTVITAGDDNTDAVALNIQNGITYNEVVTPQLFDLTQMFGVAIADYVYSIDMTSAGAGAAWFKNLFTADYYNYNTGELLSVSGLQSHDTVGFNQFDLSEFARLYPDQCQMNGDELYFTALNAAPLATGVPVDIPADKANGAYFTAEVKAGTAVNPRLMVYYADGTSTILTYTSSTTYQKYSTELSAKRIVKVTTDYSSNGTAYYKNVCINLSWSGTHNGEYKPYEKHSYALDDSLTLRGIPKLDAGKLYYDGDEYASDGSVKRKYGTKTLAASDVQSVTTDYTNVTYAVIPVPSDGLWSLTKVGISSKFERPASNIWPFDTSNGIGKMLTNSGDRVYWFGFAPGTTLEQAQTALTGVQILYELATPTTEEAEPYNSVQICDDWGTEEFVSDSIVPVGHETRYPANLRDKVQHLPGPAANDGTYVISQNNSLMTLVPLTTPTELPAAPSSNGTYKLRCVVSNGTATYSWVADS